MPVHMLREQGAPPHELEPGGYMRRNGSVADHVVILPMRLRDFMRNMVNNEPLETAEPRVENHTEVLQSTREPDVFYCPKCKSYMKVVK